MSAPLKFQTLFQQTFNKLGSVFGSKIDARETLTLKDVVAEAAGPVFGVMPSAISRACKVLVRQIGDLPLAPIALLSNGAFENVQALEQFSLMRSSYMVEIVCALCSGESKITADDHSPLVNLLKHAIKDVALADNWDCCESSYAAFWMSVVDQHQHLKNTDGGREKLKTIVVGHAGSVPEPAARPPVVEKIEALEVQPVPTFRSLRDFRIAPNQLSDCILKGLDSFLMSTLSFGGLTKTNCMKQTAGEHTIGIFKATPHAKAAYVSKVPMTKSLHLNFFGNIARVPSKLSIKCASFAETDYYIDGGQYLNEHSEHFCIAWVIPVCKQRSKPSLIYQTKDLSYQFKWKAWNAAEADTHAVAVTVHSLVPNPEYEATEEELQRGYLALTRPQLSAESTAPLAPKKGKGKGKGGQMIDPIYKSCKHLTK